jgi:RNA polymerase sigma factor (TIGR02999 family)
MEQGEVTQLLSQYHGGDGDAFEKIFSLVYEELRRTAAGMMRSESSNATLQATALVHETYIRLLDQRRLALTNRGQFFAIAARFMRRILVDAARARYASKRGGDEIRVDFTQNLMAPSSDGSQIVEIDEALTQLAKQDERCAQIVEMRYFGGYENEEIAEILNISIATVKRDLTFAKAWLLKTITAIDL